MRTAGLAIALTLGLLFAPPQICLAGDNPDVKLAMHLIASSDSLGCDDLVPAACDSINVDLSIEELFAADGYGYVALLAYDVSGMTSVEFALEGWPSGRGAPPFAGPSWCTEGATTFGDHLASGGATGLGACAEPDSTTGLVLLGYLTFGPLDSTDVPINLDFLPSTYTEPEDSLLAVTDCTEDFVVDEVVSWSGCTVGGTYSGSEPDCPDRGGGEDGGGGEMDLTAQPERLYADLRTGDSMVVHLDLQNWGQTGVSYLLSVSEGWISVDPDSGWIESRATERVEVTLHAPEFPSGRYEGRITVRDGERDEPGILVPVVMSTFRRAVKGYCGTVENEYIEGQIYFKVSPGVSRDQVLDALSDVEGVLVRPVGRIRWGVAEVPPGRDQDAAMYALAASPLIEGVERNWVLYPRWTDTPNDTSYHRQWPLNHTESNSPDGCEPHSDIDMPGGWQITKGSSNVLIAIVDSGIAMEDGELCHPDLDDEDRILIGGNYSGIGDSTDVTDTQGHGTFVTGIAAASANDSAGIAGVCPECQVIVFKDQPYDTCVTPSTAGIDGIVAAVAAGADVVNFSAGMYCGYIPEPWEDAIAYADANDCIIVNAIANESSYYWHGVPERLAIFGKTPGHECGYKNIIPVAASNCRDSLAEFSSWGPMVGVVAPGGTGEFLSKDPDDVLSDWKTYWQDPGWVPCPVSYVRGTGCSFAAPHVTGLAALIRSLGSFGDSMVRDIIYCTADQIDSEEHPYDNGIVCWDSTEQTAVVIDTLECPGSGERCRNQFYGYGRINAARALSLAESLAASSSVDAEAASRHEGRSPELRQNRPNPFNPTTEVDFYIPADGPSRLVVYDVQGRRVRTLVDGQLRKGRHSVVWDGRNDSAGDVRSGVYFLHLTFGTTQRTVKLVLLE